jgi:colicin import membrane protein
MNAVMNSPQPEPGKRLSLALTVAVHVLLAIFLIYGIRWQTQAPEAVEVELVRALPAAAPRAAPPEPKVEPRIEPKPLPPLAKPDIAIKEKPKPVKEAPAPRPDPFQEQLKREQQELSQRKATDAASAELSKVKAAQDKQRDDQKMLARENAKVAYAAKISGRIRGNIVLPPDVKGNPEAVFEVTLFPWGEISAVRLMKSSGYATLDAAYDRAILKSSPLPKPDQPEMFERVLKLRLRPLDD